VKNWCSTLLKWGIRRICVNPSVVAFGPVLPARIVHEVSRAEEVAERRRAHSVDHAGLEVKEHRARGTYLPSRPRPRSKTR
jgi:hypothetical protein